MFGLIVVGQNHVFVFLGLVQGAAHRLLDIFQADVAGFAQFFAKLFRLELTVEFRGELAHHAAGTTNPAPGCPGRCRQPFGAENQ